MLMEICRTLSYPGGSAIMNLPAMQETRVRSLGGEDPLEEGMATHSSAWRIPWTEDFGRLQSIGSHRVRHDWSDQAAAAASYPHSRGNREDPPNWTPGPQVSLPQSTTPGSASLNAAFTVALSCLMLSIQSKTSITSEDKNTWEDFY